ncbi:SCO7613 C-terminal domain-containing membrane protein [Sanguibacter suaedae]|uniref:DUF2157 domain-containing protein n=1 Tax=Sanguibacter suaedae TaxID=2795737 RepID=A0A934I497_9MICO|nr:hypothetical protein [Sanguibacter suaedae]MBI9114948.1 hypothetical protein [Sanguibacter suaedae]
MTTTPPPTDPGASSRWVDRALLTDPTRCPACGAPLHGGSCSTCGLSLSDDEGTRLWALSSEAADAIDRRQTYLGSVVERAAARRAEQAASGQAAARGAATLPAAVRQPGAALSPRPAPHRPGTAPAARWASSAPDVAVPGPRSSMRLQTVLLLLGVVLLGGASITFLAFSWGEMPLAARALVVAGATAGVFTGAHLAGRRGLRSSAEAVATLGTLLVLLDAWAVRATGLVDGLHGAVYAAIALLVCSGLLVALGSRLGLVAPRIAGVVLLPHVAAALLPLAGSVVAGTLLVLAACAVAMVRALPGVHRFARIVLDVQAWAYLATTLTWVAATTIEQGAVTGALVLLLTAAVAWAWAVVAAPGPLSRSAWAITAGAGAASGTSLLAAGPLGRIDAPSILWITTAASVLTAIALGVGGRRSGRGTPVATAAFGAWCVALLSTAVPAVAVAVLLLEVSGGYAAPVGHPVLLAALVSIAVLSIGAAASRSTVAHPTFLAHTARWSAALLLLGLALLAPAGAWRATAWLVVALSAAALGSRTPRSWRASSRAAAACAALLALRTGVEAVEGMHPGLDVPDGRWLVTAALVTAALLVLSARGWVTPGPTSSVTRAVLLASALLLAATAIGVSAVTLSGARSVGWYVASLPASLLTLLALRSRRPSTAPRRRWHHADLGAILVASALLAVPATVASVLEPDVLAARTPAAPLPVWVLALATLTAVAILGQVLLVLTTSTVDGPRSAPPGSSAWAARAAAACTPVAALLVMLTGRSYGFGPRVEWSLVALVVLTACVVLAGSAYRRLGTARPVLEISTATCAALVLLLLPTHGQLLVLALLLCSVGTTAWALTPGRARLGWAALTLAVLGSWVQLDESRVQTVEAYTAPAATALLLVGLWHATRGRHGTPPLLAGILLLVLPTALLTPTTEPWRQLVSLGAALVLATTVQTLLGRTERSGDNTVRGSGALRTVQLLTLLGLVTSTVAIGGRALVVAGGTTPTGPSDSPWLLVPSAVVLTALFTWFVGRTLPTPPTLRPAVWGPSLVALVGTAPLGLLILEDQISRDAAPWVVAALVGAWGAATVLGTPPGRPRVRDTQDLVLRTLPPVIGAYASVVLLGPGTGARLDLLFLLAGLLVTLVTVRAAQTIPTTTTWQTVHLGALGTLVPTTLSMIATPDAARVTLAVVLATAWVLAGLRLRWQSPVALGGAALLLQAFVLLGRPTLAVLAGAPGWLVLAVTGGVLLALGFTYERQLASARATARRFADLR